MANQPINVLLVDDDAEYVAVAKHYLQSYQHRSFEVTWVKDGESAITHLGNHHETEVVLMDYYLPTMNGVETAREISKKNINVPMILLTTSREFRIAIEAMKYGVEEYLLKEDTVDSILPRTIINVIERFQLKRRIAEVEKEKNLSRTQKEAIQELVVTMCHEFNNPLAAIKISADILARRQGSQVEKELLNKLNHNISILEQQIVKLRDINTDNEQRDPLAP